MYVSLKKTIVACFLTGLLIFPHLTVSAQDMARVKATIQTLTSPEFHGRGYVNGGDRIAANYLQDQFKGMGLKMFGTSYFQPFTTPINTFPGKIRLKLDKKELIPGKDFIVDPISQKGKGTATIQYLDKRIFSDARLANEFLAKNLKKTMLVYEPADYANLTEKEELLEKVYTAKALVELQKDKLTASVSTAALSHPVFEVVKKDWDTTARKAKFRVDAKFIPNYQTQNVIGYVEGKDDPEEYIVFSAHYDHLGRLGKDVYFPGANDNASGTTLLLELARYYSRPENQPSKSIVFMCFAGEEAGLLGSKYYTEHPLFLLSKISLLINMDLLGTGDDGIMMVNGLKLTEEFDAFTRLNDEKKYFSKLQKRDNAPNSDHFFFTRKGVKACFFYTLGGIKAYHDIYDRAETLPLTRFKEAFSLMTDFVAGYK